MKKMKFTKQEINEVSKYLDKKELYYADLRYEILDHILLDIEHEITVEKVSFDEAFENSCDKWKGSFYRESSYWLGIMYRGPRIFIDRCVKIQRPFLMLFFVSFLFFAILSFLIKPVMDFELLFYFTLGVSPIYISCVLYWWIKIKISRTKTSFSFLFYRYIVINFLMNFIVLNQLYETQAGELNLADFYYLIFGFNVLYHGYYLYKNHQREVLQLKKYKDL